MGIKVIIGTNSSGKTFEINKPEYKDYKKIDIEKPDDDLKLSAANQLLTKNIVEALSRDVTISNSFVSFAGVLSNEIEKIMGSVSRDLDLSDFNDWSISENEIKTKDNYEALSKVIHNFIDFFSSNMGSGHKTYWLLKMATKVSVDDKLIFDEPEKYLHPSLITKFAAELKELSKNKDIIVITHSVEMARGLIDDLSEIEIKNPHIFTGGSWSKDYERTVPIIDKDFWDKVASGLNEDVVNNSVDLSEITTEWKSFELDFIEEGVFSANKIEIWHKKYLNEIIESIFWKKVVLTEGLIESIIFKEYIKNKDWMNIDTFGKSSMPVVSKILTMLFVEIKNILDEDKIIPLHSNINKLIEANDSLKMIEKIEDELGISNDWEGKRSYYDTKKKVENAPNLNKVLSKIEQFLLN